MLKNLKLGQSITIAGWGNKAQENILKEMTKNMEKDPGHKKWWDKASAQEKEQYLKEHPHSKYAKTK